MTIEKITLGRQGEHQAVSFLKKNGFTILETGFRTPTAEIDIIATETNIICFIEVKTRKSLKKGLPRESVTRAKQQKIISGASYYLKKNNLFQSPVRFDVIEVTLKNGQFSIHHIKQAYTT